MAWVIATGRFFVLFTRCTVKKRAHVLEYTRRVWCGNRLVDRGHRSSCFGVKLSRPPLWASRPLGFSLGRVLLSQLDSMPSMLCCTSRTSSVSAEPFATGVNGGRV